MRNDVPFQDLIDDLEMFMEVKFLYKDKTYSITYDEERSYIFDMDNPKELVSLPTERTSELIYMKIFNGLTLKEAWQEIKLL